MNKNQVIGAITQAQSALNAIPAGRVDSLRGTVAFQREIIAFRGLFALFVNALHGFAGQWQSRRSLLAENASSRRSHRLTSWK